MPMGYCYDFRIELLKRYSERTVMYSVNFNKDIFQKT